MFSKKNKKEGKSRTCNSDFSTLGYISESCNYMHSSIYVNEISTTHSLINLFDSVDEGAAIEMANNKEFSSFLRESIQIIETCNQYATIRLEEIEDFDRKAFRILYHLNYSIHDTSINFNINSRIEKPIYKKLLKNLFKKSAEIKSMMVLDERSF